MNVKIESILDVFEFLGWGWTVFFLLILSFVFILKYVFGIFSKGELFGIKMLDHFSINRKIKKAEKKMIFEHEHNASCDVGFVIPKNYVYIYGDTWTSGIHEDLYIKLEKEIMMSNICAIHIGDTNITSKLISILENLNKNCKKGITIFHSDSQKSLLNYLKNLKNIKLTAL